MHTKLLILEDDPALNQMLVMHFEDEGFEVDGVMSCADALGKADAEPYDLVLIDQQLPDGKGIDVLERLVEGEPDLPVVMMTGQHDLELAIEAIERGAADFVHKPVQTDRLTEMVGRLLANRRLCRQTEAEQGPDDSPREARDLIGRSAAMLNVSKEIALSARSGATVLITGESGTGKEVVARLIHQHSGRSGPFVAVNCAAIVDTLLESELFGHEKGAFTGAQSRKPGKFELAQDGTLFLDEIGELAAPLQAKLLRALQERVFERVGGTQPVSTNTRVVAATNRDLTAEAVAGRFREDLVYRLDVIQIRMPPLRERKEDVPLLVDALLRRIAERIDKPLPKITDETMALLQAHDWPGNVRELENLLTQATVRARTGVVTPDLLDLGTAAPKGETANPENGDTPKDRILRTLDQVEAEHIQLVLDYTTGHKGKTCDILGISRPALDRKIAKYDLVLPQR